MRKRAWSIVLAAAMAACGGSAFTSGGGSADAGATKTDGGSSGSGSGGASEAGTEGGVPVPSGTYCGPNLVCTGSGMQQGTVCCVSGDNPPSYECAGAQCGCATQLDCSSDAECGLGTHCCIDDRKDTACSTGHWIARCQAVCLAEQLCDPAGPPAQCLAMKSCTSDASNVGLPSNAGFGVCQ